MLTSTDTAVVSYFCIFNFFMLLIRQRRAFSFVCKLPNARSFIIQIKINQRLQGIKFSVFLHCQHSLVNNNFTLLRIFTLTVDVVKLNSISSIKGAIGK